MYYDIKLYNKETSTWDIICSGFMTEDAAFSLMAEISQSLDSSGNSDPSLMISPR